MIQSEQLELGQIGMGKFKIAATTMNLIKIGKNDGTFKTRNLLFGWSQNGIIQNNFRKKLMCYSVKFTRTNILRFTKFQ